MKPRNKLTTTEQQQTEQTGQLQAAKESVLEFKTPEELLRHDAAQVSVPPAVAARLYQSTSELPPPPRKWWQRLFH